MYDLYMPLNGFTGWSQAGKEDTVMAKLIESAVLYLKEKKTVPKLIVIGGLSLDGKDQDNRSLEDLSFALDLTSREIERDGKWLERPIRVEFLNPQGTDIEKFFVDALERISKNYAKEKVMLRRHKRVMAEMSISFGTFMRLGRWGTCADCQCLTTHLGNLKLSENCVNTDRYDHQLTAKELFDQYDRRINRP